MHRSCPVGMPSAKTDVREIVPGVRIPPPPQSIKSFTQKNKASKMSSLNFRGFFFC